MIKSRFTSWGALMFIFIITIAFLAHIGLEWFDLWADSVGVTQEHLVTVYYQTEWHTYVTEKVDPFWHPKYGYKL